MKNKSETILFYNVEVLKTLHCSQHEVSFKHSTILFISKSTRKKILKTEPRMDRGCLLLIKVVYYFEVLWQWTIPWIIQWTIQGRLIRRGTDFRVLFSWDDGSHIRALGCNRTCYSVGSEVNVTKFHFFAWEATAANKFDCHGSCRTSSNVLEAHFTNLNFRRNLKIKMRQQKFP